MLVHQRVVDFPIKASICGGWLWSPPKFGGHHWWPHTCDFHRFLWCIIKDDLIPCNTGEYSITFIMIIHFWSFLPVDLLFLQLILVMIIITITVIITICMTIIVVRDWRCFHRCKDSRHNKIHQYWWAVTTRMNNYNKQPVTCPYNWNNPWKPRNSFIMLE